MTGRRLAGGWVVGERIVRSRRHTGGCFSEAYRVENDGGQSAFLKALDYSRAFAAADPPTVLEAMTAAFNFERAVLEKCAKRMSRVVTVLATGTIQIDENKPESAVSYLVFELADEDVRDVLLKSQQIETAWCLRTLHQVSVGLSQLHSNQILHQDVKPSNVLLFKDYGSKLGDLGRARDLNHAAPHDSCAIAGVREYAPYELLYGYRYETDAMRGLAADSFLLGSLIVCMFRNSMITPLVLAELDPSFHYTAWGDSYEEVLPYLIESFEVVMCDVNEHFSGSIGNSLNAMVRELCHPDPRRRGDPQQRRTIGNPLSLYRYMARFDVLATRAELASR